MKAIVKWRSTAGTYEVDSGKTLLHGLLEHGIEADFQCLIGHCGSCRVRLLQGKVDHACVPGLSKAERDSGIILLCSSFPASRSLELALLQP